MNTVAPPNNRSRLGARGSSVGSLRWLIALLVVAVAGWMIFDGVHALATGDFVTPKSGEYAGRLGPWAAVCEAVGISPRSTPVKVGFIAYGAVYLGFLAAFLRRRPFGWSGLACCALVGLLYLVVGTVFNAVVLGLLFLPSVRREQPVV